MVNKVSPQEAERLGARLKAVREQRGQTLQVVSGAASVDYSQLSRIERGNFKTISKNVQKICKLLGVTIAEDAQAEQLHLDIANKAALVAAQSLKNRLVLEAVLNALDNNH